MNWKIWEIDSHQKRTYQCYLPETTPLTNTLVQVVGWSFFYGLLYFAHGSLGLFMPFDFNLKSYAIWVLISVFILGAKNLYKWQSLERRLFDAHQNSETKPVNYNAN